MSAFGNKRGRKEWTAAEFPPLGRSKSISCDKAPFSYPPNGPSSSFCQETHHSSAVPPRSSRTISEMFETSTPAPVSCPRSTWVWITSKTCSDTSYLSNIKSLAAEPSCVIVYFPIMSEHPENLHLSFGWGAQRWWGSLLDVAGEKTFLWQQYFCLLHTSLLLRGEPQ